MDPFANSILLQKAMACVFAALKSTRVHGAHCRVNDSHLYNGAMYRVLGFTTAEPSILTKLNDNVTIFVRSI